MSNDNQDVRQVIEQFGRSDGFTPMTRKGEYSGREVWMVNTQTGIMVQIASCKDEELATFVLEAINALGNARKHA